MLRMTCPPHKSTKKGADPKADTQLKNTLYLLLHTQAIMLGPNALACAHGRWGGEELLGG